MTEAVLKKSIFLKATKAIVWEFLTNPDKLSKWFHKPQETLKVGPYEMHGVESGGKLMWGEVVVCDPFDRLEYTFTIAPMGGAKSTVRFELTEVPGGTNLTLLHEGLPQGTKAFDLLLALDKGWDDHLARMRSLVHDG